MKRHTIECSGGAINDTFGPVAHVTYVDALLVHLSAAPATSGNFTVSLDSALGAAFDTVLYNLQLQAASTVDIFSALAVRLDPGDGLRTTYTNADGRTIGVIFQLR